MPPVKREDVVADVPLSAITRREFLHLGGAAALAAFPGCAPLHPGGEHPDGIRPPSGPESTGHAICDLCASGCGVTVRVVGGRAVGLSGNGHHPVNAGALCPRGAAALQHLYDLDRVVGPARRVSGGLVRVSWDEALAELAARVAGGGVVLLDALRGVDADLAARFARAAGATRVPVDQTREAHQRAVGTQTWDWADTKLAVFFGCEFAEDAPDLMASLRAFAHRRAIGGRTVYVGSRFSISAGLADEFVPVRPGTEGALALGMAHVLLGGDVSARAPASYRDLVARFSPDVAAQATGLQASTIARLARDFASTSSQVAIGWRGLLDQRNGVDALLAVHALNRLVGADARLAAPPSPPLAEWGVASEADAAPSGPTARVLITAGGNPAFAAPEVYARFAEARFRVAIGPLLDETAARADLVLPTPTFLERFDVDVPASATFAVAASAAALPPLHDTRSIGDILIGVAHRVPALRAALPWDSYEEAARERLFGLFLAQPDDGREEKWEKFLDRVLDRGVWTGDLEQPPKVRSARATDANWPATWEAPAFAGDGLVLLTFAPIALGDGQGASLPWLQEIAGWQHQLGWDSWIELHPRHGYSTGERVRVRSPHGELRARVVATPTCPPEVAAMPLGQGHSAAGRWAANRGADPRQLGRGVRVQVSRI